MSVTVQPAVIQWKVGCPVRDRIRTFDGLSAKAPDPGHAGAAIDPVGSRPGAVPLTERPDVLTALGDMLGPGQMLIAGVVREEGGSAAPTAVLQLRGGDRRWGDRRRRRQGSSGAVRRIPAFRRLLERFGIDSWVAGLMTLRLGNERHAITLPDGIRALPFICYEVIFPDLVAVDATSAQLIVNVTNDAWPGHAGSVSAFQAGPDPCGGECGLPFVACCQHRISAVVDTRGRVSSMRWRIDARYR
jgi:apolipoprotein N-acyltransferase